MSEIESASLHISIHTSFDLKHKVQLRSNELNSVYSSNEFNTEGAIGKGEKTKPLELAKEWRKNKFSVLLVSNMNNKFPNTFCYLVNSVT